MLVLKDSFVPGVAQPPTNFFRSKTALLGNTLKLPKLKNQSSFATFPRCSGGASGNGKRPHVCPSPRWDSRSRKAAWMAKQAFPPDRFPETEPAWPSSRQSPSHVGGSWLRSHQPWQGKQKWNILSFNRRIIYTYGSVSIGWNARRYLNLNPKFSWFPRHVFLALTGLTPSTQLFVSLIPFLNGSIQFLNGYCKCGKPNAIGFINHPQVITIFMGGTCIAASPRGRFMAALLLKMLNFFVAHATN